VHLKILSPYKLITCLAIAGLFFTSRFVAIGNQTAGADGNQTRMIFPGNYKILFSGLGIYHPNGD